MLTMTQWVILGLFYLNIFRETLIKVHYDYLLSYMFSCMFLYVFYSSLVYYLLFLFLKSLVNLEPGDMLM